MPEAGRAAYELHTCRMLPFAWNEGVKIEITLPPLIAEPLSADFHSRGFDAVSETIGIEFTGDVGSRHGNR